MARTPAGFKTRLEPQDEFPHDPGEAKNYNESMYFNVFDPASKAGGWFQPDATSPFRRNDQLKPSGDNPPASQARRVDDARVRGLSIGVAIAWSVFAGRPCVVSFKECRS